MGLYYCGGFDWTFNTTPITTAADIGLSIPQSEEYIAYATAHWHELIERYQPSLMWGDVGYPSRRMWHRCLPTITTTCPTE